MSSGQKVPQDAKKEEFRKYLEKAGVLELLTKSLVQLYEEPQKPDDALGYLKKSVGGSLEDKRTIEALHKENEDLKKRVSELESQQAELQAKLTSLESAAAAPIPDAVVPAVEAVAAPVAVAETAAAPAADSTPPAPVISQGEKEVVDQPAVALETADEPMETEGEAAAPAAATDAAAAAATTASEPAATPATDVMITAPPSGDSAVQPPIDAE